MVCQKVAERVASRTDQIVQDIRDHGLARDSRGRALNPFPQVPDLEADATSFLIHAKRAILSICGLPAIFLSMDPKDNNFDALMKTLSQVSAPQPLTKFVRDNAPGIRYLIELRNFQEHPKAKRTIVENFHVMPDGSISAPTWYVTGETPRRVREEMDATIEFLIEMAEGMLIHLVMGAVIKQIPFIIETLDGGRLDPKKPIRYRLSADFGRMRQNAS